MSLTSSLFSGISGLATLGNSMQIIGDNIANVNTVGFKGSAFIFQDLLSQETATQSGTAQIGRGTALGDVMASFEQGSFESTGNSTDLGIGGDGFFILREFSSEQLFYSRAGNFRFDKDGYLVNPEGYVVQGWQLDEDGEDIGSVSDIQLASFTSPPEESTEITIISNLDSDELSNTDWLSNVWDGRDSATVNMQPINYEYQSTVKVFDSLGSTHDLTVYYDKVSGSTWEYIITCNPSEDMRAGFTGTDRGRGLLARGMMEFSQTNGQLTGTGLSMELFNAPTTSAETRQLTQNTIYTNSGAGTITSADVGITVNNHNALTDVTLPSPTASLTYTLATDTWAFTGGATPAGYGAASVVSSSANSITIDLDGAAIPSIADLSLTVNGTPADGDVLTFDIVGSDRWTSITPDPTTGYYQFNPDFIGGVTNSTAMTIDFNPGTHMVGTQFENDSLTTTQFSRSSTTVFQSANGYGAGDLQGVDVDVDGVITGIYTNGQLLPLNRVALAKFNNVQELEKEGGSLYRETRNSGDAITNHPGTSGLGDISPNSLEQSNVDIANEFVKMITSQRGFQANSKIITTVDSMLAEVIGMKR